MGFGVPSVAQVEAAPPLGRGIHLCYGCNNSQDIEVHYRSSGTQIASGAATFDLGSTPRGTPVTFDDFAIGAIQDLDDLQIATIAVPNGFTLTAGPASPGTINSGASVLARVRCDASSEGVFTGDLVITSDDPDEGAFTIHLTCTVTAATSTGSLAGIPLTGGTPELLLAAASYALLGGLAVLVLARRPV